MSFLRLNDYDMPGHDLRVSLGMEFKSEDASGETSSTARASKGNKGKTLDVRLFIPFVDKQQLAELSKVLEAQENGENRLYTITNELANISGMRQGRVSGSFKIDPQDKLLQWLVSFSLEEHKSVPERAASRQQKPAQTTQTSEGESVVSTSTAESPMEEAAPELNWLEQKLKDLDNFLAD